MNSQTVRFAVIGDCHYSQSGNYATRDCLGAKKRFSELIGRLNGEKLDFVLCLGDLGNGDNPDELEQMLEIGRMSVHPIKYVIGNHDLVQRSDTEHACIAGMDAPSYAFSCGGYRFIVLNAFEQSRYSRNENDLAAYRTFRESHPFLKVQEWPGLMREESLTWLENTLKDACARGEDVIVFSHVPAFFGTISGIDGFRNIARIPDYRRVLEMLDACPRIRAYIAGHLHSGGLALRNGVLHKTVRSICDYSEPTAIIAEAGRDRIAISGLGAESDFIHTFVPESAAISGTAPADSFVMTNCGDICRVGEDGRFSLPVPCPGMYALKAVMDGCDDKYIPWIKAPAEGIAITLEKNAARRLYHGKAEGYHLLHITDDGEPVRWFDIAGTPYGSVEPMDENEILSTEESIKTDKPPAGTWHEHSRNYFCKDEYAFTAVGKVEIDIVPKHECLKEAGWYKGDLHAHMIHGENLYYGNVQTSAFIGRAEGYDWLYMAANHGNDGVAADVSALAKRFSDDTFLYRMNEEYPKARGNHFGNCCVEAPWIQADMTRISSLEMAEAAIWRRGGLTVPVHPFEGHMCFREMPLWLNCAPEKMPCMDFFYHDTYPHAVAEDYWFMLLNRGYEIGCFCSSDAAFDVGRTPGSDRGCTYLKMNALSEESIKDAILHRRTMVSWDSAAILFGVDDAVSGDHLKTDGQSHTLHAEVFWRKGRRGTLRIVQNGNVIDRHELSFDSDDEVKTITLTVSSKENGWVLPILEAEDGRFRSAASPVFFRNGNYRPPEVLPLPRPCPKELIDYCDHLTAIDLADPALIDRFADLLRALQNKKE